MAIITTEGGARRRVLGISFWKMKGSHYYILHMRGGLTSTFVGPCALVDTKGDPRDERFHYCSGTSQPVFLDASEGRGYPAHYNWREVSWTKLPEGWQAAFRDYLKEVELWPAK